MTYSTRDIAGAFGLTETAIRQWLCRAPNLTIGRIDGQVRSYSTEDALTIGIAAEMLRHSLGRPHEVMPVARGLARSAAPTAWVHRPRGGPIQVTSDWPETTAINIPVSLLRQQLSGSSNRSIYGQSA